MAVPSGGEPATCACLAVGVIVERPHYLDVKAKWFVIEHENGERHTVEVYWTGEAYRFKMKDNPSLPSR